MKKLFLRLLAVAALVSAPLAFAETDTRLTGGYISTGLPEAKLPLPIQSSLVEPVNRTNIVIINFSPYYLHAMLPEFPGVDQPIVSGGTGIISHPTITANTRVAIMNGNTVLFDMRFCRYAIAIVDQGPPYFRLNSYDFYCK
jgi:hypothetical protein